MSIDLEENDVFVPFYNEGVLFLCPRILDHLLKTDLQRMRKRHPYRYEEFISF
jgi:hypothetical protein